MFSIHNIFIIFNVHGIKDNKNRNNKFLENIIIVGMTTEKKQIF